MRIWIILRIPFNIIDILYLIFNWNFKLSFFNFNLLFFEFSVFFDSFLFFIHVFDCLLIWSFIILNLIFFLIFIGYFTFAILAQNLIVSFILWFCYLFKLSKFLISLVYNFFQVWIFVYFFFIFFLLNFENRLFFHIVFFFCVNFWKSLIEFN